MGAIPVPDKVMLAAIVPQDKEITVFTKNAE
jgi:hypothetical protein